MKQLTDSARRIIYFDIANLLIWIALWGLIVVLAHGFQNAAHPDYQYSPMELIVGFLPFVWFAAGIIANSLRLLDKSLAQIFFRLRGGLAGIFAILAVVDSLLVGDISSCLMLLILTSVSIAYYCYLDRCFVLGAFPSATSNNAMN